MTSLEHRLSTLSIQLDSQQIDSVDTDSQLDRQGENPDIEPVATVETVYTVEAVTKKIVDLPDTLIGFPIETVESVATVEIADNVESVEDTIEPVQPAGPFPGDGISINKPCNGMNAMDAAKYLKDKKVKVSYDSLNRWINKEKIPNTSPQGRDVRKHLILINKLYYPID